MDFTNVKQETNDEEITWNGKIENQNYSDCLGHLHAYPSVKQEEKERTMSWFHESTTPFTDPLHPQLYIKEEGNIAEIYDACSQGEASLVHYPFHALENGYPHSNATWPQEVKRELASEDEQKSNLAGDSLDISIKKEITDVYRVDQDSTEDYENKMNTSEDEDSGEDELINDSKSASSDEDIAKTAEEDEFPQSIPDTDIIKQESGTTEEMDEQQQSRQANKKQIFQKHIKRLYQTNETGHCVCTVCGKGFDKSQACLFHIWSAHTGEKPYTCEICGKAFKQLHSLNCHKTCHSNERPYSCDLCDKTFKRSVDMKQHKATHSDERPYSCDMCGKTFKRFVDIKQHSVIHSTERPYPCDVCGNTFKRSSGLKTHKIRCHSSERPYTCDVCGNTFKECSALNQHKKIHTNHRPYSCDVCGKAFRIKRNWRKHKALHLITHSCSVCGKTFQRSNHLKQHEASHSNGRIFSCDKCKASFQLEDSLTNHKEIFHSDATLTSHVTQIILELLSQDTHQQSFIGNDE